MNESQYYPRELAVPESGNQTTLYYINHFQPRVIAELGIYKGDTSIQIARMMQEWNGALHVFDFEHRIAEFRERVSKEELRGVVYHPNSDKYQDSYCWSLAKYVSSEATTFNYVFIDGAHTWNIDALAFLLVDRILRQGGIVDFDDYHWTIEASPSMNPNAWPIANDLYTAEQMKIRQVKMIIDKLVRLDPRYVELFPNKVFQKVSNGTTDHPPDPLSRLRWRVPLV